MDATLPPLRRNKSSGSALPPRTMAYWSAPTRRNSNSSWLGRPVTRLTQNQNPDKSSEGPEIETGVAVDVGVNEGVGVGVWGGVGMGGGVAKGGGVGKGPSFRSCFDVGALAARASAGADGGDRARRSMSSALVEVRRDAGSCCVE